MINLQSSENFKQEFPAQAVAPARAAVGAESGNEHAPSSSLRATVRGDTLTVPTFACSRCHKPSQQLGSGWVRVHGMRMHVCSSCKTTVQHRVQRVRAGLPEVA